NVPEGSRQSKGTNVVNVLQLMPDEKVTAMIKVPDFGQEEKSYLSMVTKNGIIKRTELDTYKNIRKTGVIAINLDEGDELGWVKLTDGKANIIVATKKGMSISFNEEDARVIGRTARGVRALKLREGDCVVGMDILKEGRMVLTVSETGYGRLSPIEDYRPQNRGGLGLTNYHVKKFGDIAAIEVVDPADDLMLISSDGIIIRIPIETIRVCARPSKGVRVMKVNDGEKLIAAVSVLRSDEEEAPAEGEEQVDEPLTGPQSEESAE
ncbi:MAG: DNA gyrase C-terminal beta-propeller domain-containing protein, partial [Oscillospiraceae bacterium]|nr:DNA gyrase C-terminal beta-propeller domain-containing protein [Oscillospiraceae bacterium]